MDRNNLHAQWKKLCEQHEEAFKTNFQASILLSQKLLAIGRGVSNINPTSEELTEFEKTEQSLREVQERRRQFIKDNFKAGA